MVTLDGREVKVGDRLFCNRKMWGWGEVVDICPDAAYPLTLRFEIEGEARGATFTKEGAYLEGEPRSLYWNEAQAEVTAEAEQPKPTPARPFAKWADGKKQEVRAYLEMLDSLHQAVRAAGGMTDAFSFHHLEQMSANDLLLVLCNNGVRFTCVSDSDTSENSN